MPAAATAAAAAAATRLAKSACSNDALLELLHTLVQRLSEEQETGWLISTAQELVGVADQVDEKVRSNT